MKKWKSILIILLFLACTTPVMAQDRLPEDAVAPKDLVLSKEYSSPDGRFTIRFPDVPREFDRPYKTKTGPVMSHNVMYVTNIVYWLGYIDYQTRVDKPKDVKARFQSWRDGGLAGVANQDPSVLMESDITVAGYPGKFLRIKLKDNARMHINLLLAGNRLYFLVLSTPKADPENIALQNTYEKAASDFFDSFKIIP